MVSYRTDFDATTSNCLRAKLLTSRCTSQRFFSVSNLVLNLITVLRVLIIPFKRCRDKKKKKVILSLANSSCELKKCPRHRLKHNDETFLPLCSTQKKNFAYAMYHKYFDIGAIPFACKSKTFWNRVLSLNDQQS